MIKIFELSDSTGYGLGESLFLWLTLFTSYFFLDAGDRQSGAFNNEVAEAH